MIVNRQFGAALAAMLMAGACASSSPLLRQQCYNADAQLAAVLKPLEALRAKGCGASEGGTSDCDELRREIARLAIVCQGHVPTLMANAVLAYDEHRPAESQQFLDQVLAEARSHPEAAVLRARIAIDEGNVPFARRLLEQQIKMVPDHAGLHETYAAALYLQGQFAEARRELTTAGTFGAPRWRIVYHLGLIEEALGRLDEARRDYTEAVQANPGFAPAQSRLNGLRPITATP
jgi:predicted Zn-dependent protease